jgi:general secretion pathway protein G
MSVFSLAKKNQGFTLVELLVVISVIGILAGLLLTNFVGVRGRAADTKLKNDATQLRSALRLYYNDYQHYPDASGGVLMGCGSAGTSACSAGGEFSSGSTVYMKQLPADFLYFSEGEEEFVVAVTLDNVSDSDIANSQTKCDVSGRSYVSGSFVAATDFAACED